MAMVSPAEATGSSGMASVKDFSKASRSASGMVMR